MFSLSCGGPVRAPKELGTTTSWRPAESHRSVRRSPLCCHANDAAASIETTPPAHEHVRAITKGWRWCDSCKRFLNNAIWAELQFFQTQQQTQTGMFLFTLFQPEAFVTVMDGVQFDRGFIYRHSRHSLLWNTIDYLRQERCLNLPSHTIQVTQKRERHL